MIEAVFISDLHLNPDEPDITTRFHAFIAWAATHTRAVYILGDFFHVWAGDDTLSSWSLTIAEKLAWLANQGVALYFMAGNRDFLVGQQFAALAHLQVLTEPTVIILGNRRVLLVHGDRYCVHDKTHQWFRRITRTRVFKPLFLMLPRAVRERLVQQVRMHSEQNYQKPASTMVAVVPVMLKHMHRMKADVLVHGHTHQPGLTTYEQEGQSMYRYVLSDWDDKPLLMCYDEACGFYFNRNWG